MSEDWLDVEDSPKPFAALPAVPVIPASFAERVALVESCWLRLSEKQRIFLAAFRENRFNARKTSRRLKGAVSRGAHISWMHEQDYAAVVRAWRGSAAEDALDKDRLLARQDDIVETLLTPKPVLHQGEPTGFFEVEAGAASRANEVLMKATGLLKDKEIDVNVGVGGPSFVVQVMQNGQAVDVAPPWVQVQLPEPETVDAEWADV